MNNISWPYTILCLSILPPVLPNDIVHIPGCCGTFLSLRGVWQALIIDDIIDTTELVMHHSMMWVWTFVYAWCSTTRCASPVLPTPYSSSFLHGSNLNLGFGQTKKKMRDGLMSYNLGVRSSLMHLICIKVKSDSRHFVTDHLFYHQS